MNKTFGTWMAAALRSPVLAMAATMTLAACGGAGGGGVYADQEPDTRVPTGNSGSGTAATHGQVQRSDGAIEISRDGSQYVARRRVSIANDFGGAAQAQVDLSTPNGAITAAANSGGGYGSELKLEARAATEADARRGLESITVNHTDTLTAGTLRLNTAVQFGTLSSGGTTVPGTGTNVGGTSTDIQRRADIAAGLPPAVSYAISPTAGNGAARVSGLSGTTADVTATNGAVTLNGRWNTATLSATNGIVSVSGDYASLDAGSSNGLVEGALTVSRSLSADFSATNGSVDVKLTSSSAGYDLEGSSTNGGVSIDVAGTVAVGEQSRTSAHRRSSDYDSRSVKAQVKASTVNGGVSIHQ